MKKFLVLLSILVFAVFLVPATPWRPIPTRSRSVSCFRSPDTFAAVAETQKEGALLAVDVVNKKGGLNMPWGKVTGGRRCRR